MSVIIHKIIEVSNKNGNVIGQLNSAMVKN